MKLKDKVVLVTGSSRGIGKAIAILAANNGANVVVNYSNSEVEANETVKEITQKGGSALAIKADVSSPNDVKFLFDKTLEVYGKIDVLINNAGVMSAKTLKENTENDFDKHFSINVKGVFNTLKQAEHKLEDNGKIINISSSTVQLMLPTYAIYSASKAAVEQMTRVFSKEIGRGISVNALAPGPTETDLFLNGKSEEFINKLKSMNAFNRLGKPIDIANVAVFLASDESSWISGQVIGANGAFV